MKNSIHAWNVRSHVLVSPLTWTVCKCFNRNYLHRRENKDFSKSTLTTLAFVGPRKEKQTIQFEWLKTDYWSLLALVSHRAQAACLL